MKTIPQEKPKKSINYPPVKLGSVLAAFWRAIKPQKWHLFFSVLSIFIIAAASVAIPIFYKRFFDAISAGGAKEDIAFKLLLIITEIAILNGVIWLFYRLSAFAYISYQSGTIARLKQQAYNYLMEHSYGFFTGNFTGSLVQKVNRFARAFEVLSDRLMWDVLPLFIRVVSIIVIVSLFNKSMAFVIFAWIAIFLCFNVIFSRWKLKYDIYSAEVDSKTTAYLADTITNQNTIQLFASQKFESEGYKKVTQEQARATKFSWSLDSVMEAVQSFLGFAIEFVIFYYAIKYWENGLITVGVFVMLQSYVINLIDQLWSFTRVIRNLYQAYADAKEMVEILLLPHEITNTPTATELNAEKGQIKYENLTFAFNETRQVLKNINLTINPGEKVALIGPSGAGKTTFIRLLLRLYSPTSGKILIDGQDISKVTQESLRKSIAMVPQDPVLFHRTLAENIAYGKKDATIEEIKEAARLANCEDFIKELPEGLNTYVGERGIKLSGGERQRVAIARAILKNAPILILDEATSSLDSHSEILIQDALKNLMEGRTTIVIAHRLSTIQKMDRIIVVDNGTIIEEGSHQELLGKKESLYRKLWELQAGGFLAEEENEDSDEKYEENDEDEDGGSVEAKSVNF